MFPNTVAVGLAPRHLAFQSTSIITAHDLNMHVLTKAETRDLNTKFTHKVSYPAIKSRIRDSIICVMLKPKARLTQTRCDH